MDSMPHLLLVDDDEDILSLLTAFFRKHGFSASVAEDGNAMFAALEKHTIDLIILDVMLQHEDGFSLCQRLRTTSKIPIIMLTAVADDMGRVVGLELGADDYLTKPFDQRELLARVKAVLRRAAAAGGGPEHDETHPLLCFDGWRLDVVKRELRSGDNTLVLLSSAEFDLLLTFAEHPRRVLTRDDLIDLTRGSTHVAYDRDIDVQVSRLRYKVERDPRNPSILRTIRGAGYIFLSEVTRG
jgi:two-component system OmpR family response regulator